VQVSGKHSFALLNTKFLVCSEYISRDAEGSGVPEMKGVLAGIHLHNFLSVKAFIGKWTGIVVGLWGGLSFGR
jgi:H+/Cl- antiporter ClcA